MDRIIAFDPRERILEKAKRYLKDEEVFLKEREQAIPLLLKALRFGDETLKSDIVFFLGGVAMEEAAWPLYRVLADSSQEEELRRDASLQLSAVCPFLKDPGPLVARLILDMEKGDARLRMHAALALGWEGNSRAAIPLIDRLYDEEAQVQQAAVVALCHLRDDRILNLLLERLEHGPIMQKRAILLNLRCFDSKKEEATQVYLRYLGHENADLRLDALALLGLVSPVERHFEAFRKCLKDADGRIRLMALRKLAEEGGARFKEIRAEIPSLLDDPDREVKRVALEVLFMSTE